MRRGGTVCRGIVVAYILQVKALLVDRGGLGERGLMPIISLSNALGYFDSQKDRKDRKTVWRIGIKVTDVKQAKSNSY